MKFLLTLGLVASLAFNAVLVVAVAGDESTETAAPAPAPDVAERFAPGSTAGDAGAEITIDDSAEDSETAASLAADGSFVVAVVEAYNERYGTEEPVDVRISSCEDGSYYLDGLIELCVEDVENDPKGTDADPELYAAFVLAHELGHAVIDRGALEFAGQEEDVADQFAADLVLGLDDGIDSMFATATVYQALAKADEEYVPDYSDDHALLGTRAVDLHCWIYAQDPETWSDLIDEDWLTEERADYCVDEWSAAAAGLAVMTTDVRLT